MRNPITAWEKLVAIYRPAGLEICNCSQAYAERNEDGLRICKGGCDAALIRAREHVAKKVLG